MRDADAAPAFRDHITPDAVLQPEPGHLLVVRAEHVIGIAVRTHKKLSTSRRSTRLPTRILQQ
jgi:hypothetical protein